MITFQETVTLSPRKSHKSWVKSQKWTLTLAVIVCTCVQHLLHTKQVHIMSQQTQSLKGRNVLWAVKNSLPDTIVSLFKCNNLQNHNWTGMRTKLVWFERGLEWIIAWWCPWCQSDATTKVHLAGHHIQSSKTGTGTASVVFLL